MGWGKNAVTDQEIIEATQSPSFVFVRVQAADYAYEGWIVAAGYKKRSNKLRVCVEDANGRWFIHNPLQLERIT
jgi:hypothetical protein